MAYILANLAVSRSRLQRAIRTAVACGDSKWAWDRYDDLYLLDRRIDILLRVLDPKVVAEAREITNAPI